MEEMRKGLRQASDNYEHPGVTGVMSKGLNRILVRGMKVSLVHLLTLEVDETRNRTVDSSLQRRFLTADEVRRYAADPMNGLSPDFADRIEGGFDMCFGAVHGDRLANYGWYAFGTVEPEHAAGVCLGLPTHVAYVYKVFTHPDFRGRGLNGDSLSEAATVLRTQGVDVILAMIYWSNRALFRSFERLGFRKRGLLVVGPRGPMRIPEAARRLGVWFDADAEHAAEVRRSGVKPSGEPDMMEGDERSGRPSNTSNHPRGPTTRVAHHSQPSTTSMPPSGGGPEERG